MKTYRIAVYPGDGIGPKLSQQALRVMEAVAQDGGFACDLTMLDWGLAHWERHGVVVPTDFLEVLQPMDAILLGAVGWPAKIPDHVTLAPLVKIRQTFDQYACVRPSKLYPGVRGPLAGSPAESISSKCAKIRKASMSIAGSRMHVGQPDNSPCKRPSAPRRGVERILRFARNGLRSAAAPARSPVQQKYAVLGRTSGRNSRRLPSRAEKQEADACDETQ